MGATILKEVSQEAKFPVLIVTGANWTINTGNLASCDTSFKIVAPILKY